MRLGNFKVRSYPVNLRFPLCASTTVNGLHAYLSPAANLIFRLGKIDDITVFCERFRSERIGDFGHIGRQVSIFRGRKRVWLLLSVFLKPELVEGLVCQQPCAIDGDKRYIKQYLEIPKFRILHVYLRRFWRNCYITLFADGHLSKDAPCIRAEFDGIRVNDNNLVSGQKAFFIILVEREIDHIAVRIDTGDEMLLTRVVTLVQAHILVGRYGDGLSVGTERTFRPTVMHSI